MRSSVIWSKKGEKSKLQIRAMEDRFYIAYYMEVGQQAYVAALKHSRLPKVGYSKLLLSKPYMAELRVRLRKKTLKVH